MNCSGCNLAIYRKNPKLGKSYFCTLQCMNTSNSWKRGPKAAKTCIDCHTPLQVSVKSASCKACTDFKDFCQWLSGDLSNCSYPNGEPRKFVKETLKQLRGDKCEECGFDTKHQDGISIIQMDHVDGDPTNHLLENLKLLCPNCHALTPNYGARNKGNGRKKRQR